MYEISVYMYIDATTYMYFYMHNIIIFKAVYLCTSSWHKTTTTTNHMFVMWAHVVMVICIYVLYSNWWTEGC